MIHFVKPTQDLLEALAADMRQEDVAEVWASHHHTPLVALMKGVEVSDYTTAVVDAEGTPLVIFGLVKKDLLSGSGVVWMLGSNSVNKHRKKLLTVTPSVIHEMLDICPRLCNMVHVKNKSSVRWLKWLGFILDDPEKFGPDGELFHRFYIERG